MGLSQNKLIAIAYKIKEYLPGVTSFGGFARVDGMKRKSLDDYCFYEWSCRG